MLLASGMRDICKITGWPWKSCPPWPLADDLLLLVVMGTITPEKQSWEKEKIDSTKKTSSWFTKHQTKSGSKVVSFNHQSLSWIGRCAWTLILTAYDSPTSFLKQDSNLGDEMFCNEYCYCGWETSKFQHHSFIGTVLWTNPALWHDFTGCQGLKRTQNEPQYVLTSKCPWSLTPFFR